MTKHLGEIDFPVTDIELDNGVSAGIRLRMLTPFTIPPYYEHLARIRAGIKLNEWYEMDPIERAIVYAVMQTEMSIEGHQAEAEIEAAKKRSKRQA